MKKGAKVTIAALSGALMLGSMNFAAEAATDKSANTVTTYDYMKNMGGMM